MVKIKTLIPELSKKVKLDKRKIETSFASYDKVRTLDGQFNRMFRTIHV